MSKKYAGVLTAAAIAYIIIGLILIVWPTESRLVICYALGALLVLYGAYRIIDYFVSNGAGEPVQFGAAVGIGCATAGVLLLFRANAVVAVFGVVVGVALAIDSVLRLQLALDIRRMGGGHWFPVLICAIVMLIIGGMLIFNPFEIVTTATIIAGVALALDGVLTIWSLIETRAIVKRIGAEKSRVK